MCRGPHGQIVRLPGTNNDKLLLPLAPTDYVQLPQSSPDTIEGRLLIDITKEETELLNDELLNLLALAAV